MRRRVCRVHRLAIATAAAIGALALAPAASAYSSATHAGPVYRDRWLVCHDEVDAPLPPPPRPQPKVDPLSASPVPRVPRPAPLLVVPHQPDDVSFAEPLPARHAHPRPEDPPPPVVVMRESQNTYLCTGYLRGKAGIVRVVDAPPGAHFYGHTHGDSWVEDNMDAAVFFNVTEAIPGLRKSFDRPVPAHPSNYREYARVTRKAVAANALAELGDKEYSPHIARFLLELEASTQTGLWDATFAVLARNDPAEAERYAVEVLERYAAGKKTPPPHSLYRVLGSITARSKARIMPTLARLSPSDDPGHDECKVVATRLRLGDEAVAKKLRPSMEGTLSTQFAVACYSQTVAAMYPGKDISELPALVLRRRYEAILELVHALRSDPSPKAAASRAKLKAELDKLSTLPELTAGPTSRLFDPKSRVRWLAARAGLGDAAALHDLYVDVDSADAEDAPWVGAWAALYLDLPQALEHAKKRLERGIVTTPHLAETTLDRGGISASWPARVVEILAERQSPLFALGLLQRDTFAWESAFYILSRRRDAPVCDLVASHLKDATEPSMDHALWALTTTGDRCRFAIERVARDRTQPGHLRGMALEYLAMVRHEPTLSIGAAWAKEGERELTEKAALQRVGIIARNPE